MFNQSVSKFSSSKLSVAVSAALLGLVFSTVTQAGPLRIEPPMSGDYLITDNIDTGTGGYGLFNSSDVNLAGSSLIIQKGKEDPKKTLWGFYNSGEASVSTEETKIELVSNNQTKFDRYGILTTGDLNINSPVLKISIAALGRGTEFSVLHGIRVGNKGALSLNQVDTNIELNLGSEVSIEAASIYGLYNQGTTNIGGKDNSLKIVTNLDGSLGESYAYNLCNTGTMTVEVGSTDLEITIKEGATFTAPVTAPVAVAAIDSTGSSLVMHGDRLAIKLADQGEPTGNHVLHGIRIGGPSAEFFSKSLVINGTSNGSHIYGFLVQGREGKEAVATVHSDTKIDLSSANNEERSYGILAFAGGKLTHDGNLEIHANKALAIRGAESQMNINPQGDKVVKLYGDIDFNLYYSTDNVTDPTINVVLAGPESVWEGHATVTAADTAETGAAKGTSDGHAQKEEPLHLNLHLKDGAKWIPNDSNKGWSSTNTVHTSIKPVDFLTMENGVIELTDKSGSEVKVGTLKGTGGEVHTRVAIDENSNITSNKLSIKKTEGTPSLAVHAEGITADDVKDHQAAMESFYANALSLGDGASAHTELHIPEGDVAGKLTGTVDLENKVTVQENPHTISSSVLSIASSNYLSFRSQINDVASRLGDLRSMPKTAGAWVRYYGGQTKYSDRGMKEDYNTIQIGGDGFIADKYYLGGTFSYTDGNGTLVNGSSDDKNYNFGIYGGWLGEKGQFVDVIVKRHRIKSDFDLFNALGKSSGSYRTWGTSASIEAGWRLQCPANGFYAEPQAEFMLGHVESVNYKTNRDVRIHQDGINSAIGRVGVAFGYTFPENKGNAYAKASVLHDWKGDVKASYSKDGVSRRMHDDLGGTWGEFAVGATYNPIKNLSAYGQFKTTSGSPIRTPWQASIGVRYSF